jgi:hypothetical protein
MNAFRPATLGIVRFRRLGGEADISRSLAVGFMSTRSDAMGRLAHHYASAISDGVGGYGAASCKAEAQRLRE